MEGLISILRRGRRWHRVNRLVGNVPDPGHLPGQPVEFGCLFGLPSGRVFEGERVTLFPFWQQGGASARPNLVGSLNNSLYRGASEARRAETALKPVLSCGSLANPDQASPVQVNLRHGGA